MPIGRCSGQLSWSPSLASWDQAKYASELTDCLIQKETCLHEMSGLTAWTTCNSLKFCWSNPKLICLEWELTCSCPQHTINCVQCQHYWHGWFAENNQAGPLFYFQLGVSLTWSTFAVKFRNYRQLWELTWHVLLFIALEVGQQLLQQKEVYPTLL